MKTKRQLIGRWGESVAADYLAARGYVVLDRNIRNRYGEIDLLARQGTTLVFVEVKTRTSGTYGLPEDAVTYTKRMHMTRAAEAYLRDHAGLDSDWRVDVIAIRGKPDQSQPEIILFENALY